MADLVSNTCKCKRWGKGGTCPKTHTHTHTHIQPSLLLSPPRHTHGVPLASVTPTLTPKLLTTNTLLVHPNALVGNSSAFSGCANQRCTACSGGRSAGTSNATPMPEEQEEEEEEAPFALERLLVVTLCVCVVCVLVLYDINITYTTT